MSDMILPGETSNGPKVTVVCTFAFWFLCAGGVTDALASFSHRCGFWGLVGRRKFKAFNEHCLDGFDQYFCDDGQKDRSQGYQCLCLATWWNWIRAVWRASGRTEGQRLIMASVHGHLPKRNGRMTHCRLMSLKMGVKTIAVALQLLGHIKISVRGNRDREDDAFLQNLLIDEGEF